MLFSLLKHYLDTALKVSQSVYCFTTSISHGVENYFPGCGVRASLMLFSAFVTNFALQHGNGKSEQPHTVLNIACVCDLCLWKILAL